MTADFFRGAACAAALAAAAPCQIQWQQTAVSGGPGVTAAGYAFDPARGELVVFGGESGTQIRGSTWAWDGSSWQSRAALSQPSPRGRATMVHDPVRGQVLLLGGFAGGNTFFGDTWVWDGTSWAQLSPATSPSARSGASGWFDPVRGTIVVFGGFLPNNVDSNELWEWNGTTWSPIPVAGTKPSGRGAHRVVYDEARGVAVLHGGYDRTLLRTLDDTWVWDGIGWTQHLGARPGSLCDQATVYDPDRRRIVLFGGLLIDVAASRFVDLDATWEWDGSAWLQRAPSTTPPPRNHGYAFYNAAQRRVLMSSGAASGLPIADAWAMAPIDPASVTPFGTGCPTTAGIPRLRAVTLPWLGDTFAWEIDNLPPGTPQVLCAIGVSDTTWATLPLPFDLGLIGAPGCSLAASIELPFAWPVAGGVARVRLPLGNDPALLVPWFAQAIVPDPLLPAPLPIAVTPAMRFEPGTK